MKALNTYIRKEIQKGKDKEYFNDEANDGTYLMGYKDWL